MARFRVWDGTQWLEQEGLLPDGGATGHVLKKTSAADHDVAWGAFDADAITDGTTNKVYTATEKTKLAGIESGAEANVQPDWNATTGDAAILNKPTSLPPTAHTHDDRYYTEAETDTLLAGKASASHGHVIADVVNLQTALDGKAAIGHNHDGDYADIAHDHDADYAAISHAHDDRYYTETEIDTLLAGKAASTHTHADLHTHTNKATLDATTASFTTALNTKLSGIEAGADVTDAVNVDAAGAVMNTDTTTAGMAFVVDEDTMVSNLATKVPTQQSVKAYVDAQVSAASHTHSNKTTLDAITAAYTTAEKTKLAGIAAGATVNSTDAQLRDRATHTGTQSADTITDGTTNKAYTATEKTKLAGIAAGAEVNVQADWNASSGDAAILNKPTSMPPTAHTHDDRYYTETETNARFSENLAISRFQFHDILTFGRYGPVQETFDGSSWSVVATSLNLFAGKQAALSVLTNGTTTTGVRWTWSGMAWTSVSWFLIGFTWVATGVNRTITVESSTDNVTWTNRATVTNNTTNAMPLAFQFSSIAGDSYLRLTIIDVGHEIRISTLKALTDRWGDQGAGVEVEYPFNWDANKKIIVSDLQVQKTAAAGNVLKATDTAGNTVWGTLAKADVGLGNVDNTSDAAKPISTATQTALNGKANTSHAHAAADVTSGTFAAARLPAATDAAIGAVELATTAEATTGTDTTRAVTPAGLKAVADTKSPSGHTHDDRYYTEAETTTLLAGKANTAHTHGVTDLTATGTRSSSTYLRGDNTWGTPPNTTYSLASQAEAENSASTTARLISGQRLYQAITKHKAVHVGTTPPTDTTATPLWVDTSA